MQNKASQSLFSFYLLSCPPILIYLLAFDFYCALLLIVGHLWCLALLTPGMKARAYQQRNRFSLLKLIFWIYTQSLKYLTRTLPKKFLFLRKLLALMIGPSFFSLFYVSLFQINQGLWIVLGALSFQFYYIISKRFIGYVGI